MVRGPSSRSGVTPVSRQRSNNTFRASGCCFAMTALTPGRIIAAFSLAILSSVLPRYCFVVHRDLCDGNDAAFAAVVESSRPPKPVSRIASSIPAFRKASSAMAVNCSKKVGSASICLSRSNCSETSRTVGCARRKVFGRDCFAGDSDTFRDRNEMRRSVETRLDSGSATDRVEHRRSRTFAVCSGDLNRRKRAFGIVEGVEKEFGVSEAEFDRESLVAETE